MAEGKSFSEICQDLIALVKTFQEAYKQNLQEELGQQTDRDGTQQQMDKERAPREEKQVLKNQDGNEEEEQRFEKDGLSGNQQMHNCLDLKDLKEDLYGMNVKKKKVRPENRDILGKQRNQWSNGWKVGNDIVEGIKNFKRKKKKGERGSDGSYKVRFKKGKNELNVNGWSNRENG